MIQYILPSLLLLSLISCNGTSAVDPLDISGSGGRSGEGDGTGGEGDATPEDPPIEFRIHNDTELLFWLLTDGYDCFSMEITGCEDGCIIENSGSGAAPCAVDRSCMVEIRGRFVKVPPGATGSVFTNESWTISNLATPYVTFGTENTVEGTACIDGVCEGRSGGINSDGSVERMCPSVPLPPYQFEDPGPGGVVDINYSDLIAYP